MRIKIIGLLVGILIFVGCTPSFQPKNSTCDRVHQDLAVMEVGGVDEFSYQKRDYYRLKSIADDCRKQTSLSEKDYEKYIHLLRQIKNLDNDANHIIDSGNKIHSQRIK